MANEKRLIPCKDCKWRKKSIKDDTYHCVGKCGMSAVVNLKEDDFCSYGERREGE